MPGNALDLVTLELTIPSDWTPGTKLIWLAPSNKRIQIDVPPNATPGTDIDFEVPRAILDDPAKVALRAEYAKPSVAPWLEARRGKLDATEKLSLIHISEPTRLGMISYAVFCLKKKNN